MRRSWNAERHFRNGHLLMYMDKKKVISSLVYKSLERFCVKGLGLVIGIVLARLLAPEIFGQVAVLTVFVNLSQVITESGFTTALIQRQDVTDSDYSSVFWINMALATMCIVVIQLITPWVCRFYGMEIDVHLRVYSLILLVNALNSLQIARMQKQMRFRQMMICTMIATVISGIIGIVSAYMGAGIWALMVYHMSASMVTCIAFIFVEKWYPKFEFSLHRVKLLFGYGWKMLVSALLCSLYSDIRSLIIGKKHSSDDLGFYNRGQQFPQVISNSLDSAIQAVMFPTLSSVQDKTEQMVKLLRRAVMMGTYIIVPTMFGLAAVSEPVVRLLLTEKWLPCVPYMRWICLGEAAVPIISSNLIAIKASGRSDVYMRLEMVRRVVMLCVLVVSVFGFGTVEAIAAGFGVGYWLDALIVSLSLKRLLHYGPVQQAKDIWKNVLAASVMFAIVNGMNGLNGSNVVLMLSQILIGVLSYLLLNICLHNEIQMTLISFFRKDFRGSNGR